MMRSGKPVALVVDDEPLVSMFLAEKLGEMGFDVDTAGTAEEALAVTRLQDSYTVAFIDLGLPGRSGLELIAELKSIQPDLPVVIASGYGLMAVRDIGDNNEPPAVLAKPYDSERVLDVLTNLGVPVPNMPA